MFPGIFALLTGDSAVAALVDRRIYRHGSAPQKVQAPYVTWFAVSGTPENTLSELPKADRFEIQVDCWSDNTGTGSRGIETLARAVRDALEPHAHMTVLPVDDQDFETQRYRIAMQFTFWHDRPEPAS